MGKGRVEAFSEGVFAVAATLLIFNIQIDKTTPCGLLATLLAAWPKYAAYVASFLTIGVMFMNHHGLFERIARLNRALVNAAIDDAGRGRFTAVRAAPAAGGPTRWQA
jgi:uncharacterized membrane protein